MRAVVAGWIGSTNLGDELVFAGLRTHLAALGIEPVALSIDPAVTRRIHGVDAVRSAGPVDAANVWKAVGTADALIFGGGGLVQDQTSPWNLPFHLSRIATARMRSRPWAGVGLGVDRLQSRAGRALASRGLRRAHAIAVRDAASQSAARELGIDTRLAADLALALPPTEGPGTDHLVVCLRTPPAPGVGTAARKAGAATDPEWEARLAAEIDQLASDLGLAARFVALQPDRDGELHERIAARCDADVELAEPGLDDIAEIVAGSRLVVTMRYHGAITALLAGRPAVLLDYSEKMQNLAAEVGPAFETVPTSAAGLTSAATRVLRHTGAVGEARDRLREREAVNRSVIESLMEPA